MSTRIVVRVLVVAALIASVVACLFALGKGDLTPRENVLSSILLTGLSILASWAVTEMYSSSQYKEALREVQEQHRSNLRTYALKAAEKVNNLSSELNRLGVYLRQELEYTDYRSVEDELQAKEERLESAIHIIVTLKSVNDTSLSDWRGVIGDELEEQQEEQNERQQLLESKLAEIESRLLPQLNSLEESQHTSGELQRQLDTISRDLRFIAATNGGVSLPFQRTQRSRSQVEAHCPQCGEIVRYTGKRKAASSKPVTCGSCHTRLAGKYDDDRGHFLLIRKKVPETFACTECGVVNTALIDMMNGGSAVIVCKTCDAMQLVVRSKDGIKARVPPPGALPPSSAAANNHQEEDIVSAVRRVLPSQPWPTGIHKEVAEKLRLTNRDVSRAIDILIARGDFVPQVDGTLLPLAEGHRQK